jgi:hypothetical protein
MYFNSTGLYSKLFSTFYHKKKKTYGLFLCCWQVRRLLWACCLCLCKDKWVSTHLSWLWPGCTIPSRGCMLLSVCIHQTFQFLPDSSLTPSPDRKVTTLAKLWSFCWPWEPPRKLLFVLEAGSVVAGVVHWDLGGNINSPRHVALAPILRIKIHILFFLL